MGNYFSSQKGEKEESIKIINEVDHVHVIVSNSDLKNEIDETNDLKDGTIQDISNSNSNHFQVDNALTKKIDNELDTLLQCDIQKKKYNDNIFNKTIYKKNIKKRKGKKNKKRHLQ